MGAELNGFDITFHSSEPCHDLPLIEARVLNSLPDPDGTYYAPAPNRDGAYSTNQIQHDLGIHADPGQKIRISVYFDNTAQDTLGDPALNTRGVVSFSPLPSATHTIEGFLVADNSPLVSSKNRGGDIIVFTGVPTTLHYIEGSAVLCLQEEDANSRGGSYIAHCGTDGDHRPKYLVEVASSPSSGNGARIGDIRPGFKFSGSLAADYLVVASARMPRIELMDSSAGRHEDTTPPSQTGQTGRY